MLRLNQTDPPSYNFLLYTYQLHVLFTFAYVHYLHGALHTTLLFHIYKLAERVSDHVKVNARSLPLNNVILLDFVNSYQGNSDNMHFWYLARFTAVYKVATSF